MNVILTHTLKTEEKVDRKVIFRRAYSFKNKYGISFSEALKKSWQHQKGFIEYKFSTTAESEDIAWVLHSCCTEDGVRKDLLRQWDRDRRDHPLSWVSYHLRRYGFKVSDITDHDTTEHYYVKHVI